MDVPKPSSPFDPTEAAALAVARWFDRNETAVPNSVAEALLEEVALTASYLYDTGLVDAELANQVLTAVDVAHRNLVKEYPTADARRGIDVESAVVMAKEFFAGFKSQPASPARDAKRRPETPPPKSGNDDQRSGDAGTRQSKKVATGTVFDEVFRRNRRACASVGVEYYGIERARKPFVKHSDVPAHIASEELRRSLWNFVLSTQLHVGAIVTVGQAALICHGHSPEETMYVVPVLATIYGTGRHFYSFEKTARSSRKKSIMDELTSAFATMKIGAATTGLQWLFKKGMLSDILYMRYQISKWFGPDAAEGIWLSTENEYTPKYWLGRLEGDATFAHESDRDLKLRAIVRSVGSLYLPVQDLKELATEIHRPKYASLRRYVNTFVSAANPFEWWGDAGLWGPALYTVLGLVVARVITQWSVQHYQPERIAKYLSLNNKGDAVLWKDDLKARVKIVQGKIPERTEKPQDDGTAEAQEDIRAWEQHDADRTECKKIDTSVDAAMRERKRNPGDSTIGEHDRVSTFVETMLDLTARVCKLEEAYQIEQGWGCNDGDGGGGGDGGDGGNDDDDGDDGGNDDGDGDDGGNDDGGNDDGDGKRPARGGGGGDDPARGRPARSPARRDQGPRMRRRGSGNRPVPRRPAASPARRQPGMGPPGPGPAPVVNNDELRNAGFPLAPEADPVRPEELDGLDPLELLDLLNQRNDDDLDPTGAGVGLAPARAAARGTATGATGTRASVVDAAYRARLRALRL